jgi:hypothetical protein
MPATLHHQRGARSPAMTTRLKKIGKTAVLMIVV